MLRRKDEYIPEVKPAKMYILKEILKVSENMESTKDTVLEANPDLKKSMTIHQGSFHIISCMPRRRQALFKLLLISFYNEIKTLLMF